MEFPGPLEIKAQLRNLLASPRLIKSPSQSAVLEVIVKMWLAKEPMDEQSIGGRAFPNFVAGNSSDVRINTFNLRKTLAEYYSVEGAMDLVVLEILKGRGYGVSANYNPKSEAMTLFNGVFGLMGDVSCYPWLVVDALAYCFKAIELNKDFGPAYALYAELAICYATIRRGDLGRYGVAPPKCVNGEIRLAREYSFRALRINKNIWRAWLALGICAACRHNWKLAQKYIDHASEISPEGVKGDPWYLIHVFATGKKKAAFDIVREKWKTNSPRSVWRALLMLMEGCIDHDDHTGVRLSLDERHEWNSMEGVADDVFLIEAVNALVFSKWGNYDEQLPKLEKLREKVVNEHYHLLASHGLYAMLRGLSKKSKAKRAGDAEDEDIKYAREKAEALSSKIPRERERGTANLQYSTFPVPFGSSSVGGELMFRFRDPERWVETKPYDWEIALAYIGAGDGENAVTHLRHAFDTQNPMAALWLHLWPFLDQVQETAGFMEMIREMKLPAGALPKRLEKLL